MDGKVIFFIVFFLLLVGGVIVAYFFYEKPKQQEVNDFTNLTIFIKDEEGEMIKTGYDLYMEGILYDSGLTNERGGVFQTTISNRSFILKNKNIANQSYYIGEISFHTYNITEPLRIVLDVKERGILNITQKGDFGINKSINLTLSTNKTFEDLVYCLKWSSLLIYVQSPLGEKINEIGENNKCYSTQFTLNKTNNLTIPIYYDFMGVLSDRDYIYLAFYDTEQEIFTERQNFSIHQY